MKVNAQPVRGTKDFLPNEAELRDFIQKKIADTYKQFGFQKIATPVMEDIERLNKSDGGENLAMIFKILKRGQKLDLSQENLTEDDLVDSGLRYDLTMPLSRYFANNRQFLNMPFKSIQIDRVFRAERPQKGRLREFYQCDIDIIGDASNKAEMELIAATTTALENIGFNDFTLRINDRRILIDMIKAAGFSDDDVMSVCITFDKLDKVGLDGVKAELLEKEYAPETVQKFIELIADAESEDAALDRAAEVCSDKNVVEQLRQVINFAREIAGDKFKVMYDKSLVRGMGYYTGIVFEIVSPKFGSSVAGGGRYDNMIGKFLGESVPAVGFSIGFERICSILVDEGFVPQRADGVILVYNDSDNFAEVVDKLREFQALGMRVNMLRRSKKLGKQIDALIEQAGYNYMYNMGENDELKPLGKK